MTTFDVTKEKDTFSKLKSSSSSIAYDGLLEIRSHITKTKDGAKILRENEVLKDLVSFLHKPNEKILDVTLSILGNCCMDSDCRNEVVDLGIVAPLASVLHNIARDSIQCRACRLIGNLAQEWCFAEQLLKEDIIVSIVAVLDTESSSSTATRQMAVRALRMLWSVENQREKMLNLQAVRAVALLLSLNQEKIGQKELLHAIVKALAVFTKHHSEECAQQVQGNGSGFQHLVSLVANASLKYVALTSICNLCYTSSSRPALGSVGTVKIIIKELSAVSPDNTGLYTELVLALCYLCHESVNRAKIRRAGGLPLILKVIHNASKPSLQSFVLHALIQFVYDETSLQELLKEGLIGILVTKITVYVKKHGKAHSKVSVRPEPQRLSKKSKYFSVDTDTVSESSKKQSPTPRSICRATSLSEASLDTDREQEIPKRRFRANSPSYQAVVQEQGSYNRCISRIGNPELCSEYCRETSPDINPVPRGHTSPDYYSTGDWSPVSPGSICCSPDASPPLHRTWTASPSHAPSSDGMSPPSSPSPLYSAVMEDMDCPEAYSPICYDPGDDDDDDDDDEVDIGCDDEDCNLSQDTNEDKSGDPLVATQQVSSNPVSNQQDCALEVSKHCDSELDAALFLLSRISYMDTTVEELAACSTLTALLDYITLILFPQPRAARTLLRIIRNHNYFLPLLRQRFILTVQSRLCQPQHSTCWICNEFKTLGQSLYSQMTMYAQSGYGEGELAHQLLKGDESVQRALAVTIPYIVRIQRILWKLMVECGALKTLVELLDNSNTTNDGLLKYVPTSLKMLAVSLDVPNPYDRSEGEHHHDERYPHLLDDISSEIIVIPGAKKASDDTVFLQLDDGSSVQVSKTFLSSQSPMFEAMFRGGFKESNEDYVSLPGISRDCLINLLRIMKLGNVSSCFFDVDLNSSLELVAVLDRFLISGSEELIEMILSRYLSPSTVFEIYTRCIEAGDVSHFHSLRYDTVRFMLTSSVSCKKFEKMYQEILQSTCSKQLLADITHVLQEKLNQVPRRPFKYVHSSRFKANI